MTHPYPSDSDLGFCEACKGVGCPECESSDEPKVYDLFTASGRPFKNGYCYRVTGENTMMETCKKLEAEYGALYVRHGGYLDMFVQGWLRNAQAGLDKIARAVAQDGGK